MLGSGGMTISDAEDFQARARILTTLQVGASHYRADIRAQLENELGHVVTQAEADVLVNEMAAAALVSVNRERVWLFGHPLDPPTPDPGQQQTDDLLRDTSHRWGRLTDRSLQCSACRTSLPSDARLPLDGCTGDPNAPRRPPPGEML